MNNIVKEFNKISVDFLEQTSQIAGKSYLCKFKFITGINNMYAIDRFIKNVLPYKDFINARDEEFFLNKNVDSEFSEDIAWIKQAYFTLDDESKENIWNIVTALVLLAEERLKLTNKSNKTLPA
jgi:hypothetical protein